MALDRALFVAILQAAYSGELAAALAYRGHWRSLWRAHRTEARAEIRRIEAEEWHHRREVGKVLAELGSGPQRWREVLMWSVGRFFGTLCFVGGWFGPLYAAGRLEGANVGQYELAAVHARRAGLDHYLPGLALMTATEDRHERWFGSLVAHHPLLPLASRVLGWRPPPDPVAAEVVGEPVLVGGGVDGRGGRASAPDTPCVDDTSGQVGDRPAHPPSQAAPVDHDAAVHELGGEEPRPNGVDSTPGVEQPRPGPDRSR